MLSTRLSIIASISLSLLLCLLAAATMTIGEATASASVQPATVAGQDQLPGATSGITTTMHALHIPFISVPPSGPCTFTEQNGNLILEVEAVPPVDSWLSETDIPGFTGTSYYTWRGPEHHTTPGIGTLSYPVEITTGGLYELAILNYHLHPTHGDLWNDVWFRMGPQNWVKAFSWDEGHWTWALLFDFGNHVIRAATVHLEPGQYSLDLSARSANFSIDRIIMWLQGGPDAKDLSLPQSPCVFPDA